MESKSIVITSSADCSTEELKIHSKLVSVDLNLNENTHGFVTQLNNNENIGKNSLLSQNDQKNIITESSEFLNENVYRSENDLKYLKCLNKEFDFVIPSLNSQTNSFISAHKQLNHLKDESKKSFEFFPDIQIEKAKYNKKNMFDQNIYVKYLSKKVQTEAQAKKPIENSKYFLDTGKFLKAYKTPKLKNNSFNYELSSTNENMTNQVEKNCENNAEDEKYPSIIMPIKPSFKIKISNKSKQNQKDEFKFNKKKNEISPRSMSLRDEKVKLNRSESRHTEKVKLNEKKGQRKVIDLNLISNESIVSSHYMNQPVRKFADLKLNENWPSSTMYKFTIQTNPWVRSFKEKSIAHEINTNFRHVSMDDLKKTDLIAYLPSQSETKASSSFFPTIKQISF